MMIDVHCHLTGEEYESLGGVDEIVARAKRAGVEKLICSGFDLPSSIAAKNLAERHEGVYFCAGFHPSELHKYREGDLEKIKELGEPDATIVVQKYYFGRKMAEIAEMTGLKPHAAQVRCGRALKKLRKDMEQWR